jgi:hypothetical protein
VNSLTCRLILDLIPIILFLKLDPEAPEAHDYFLLSGEQQFYIRYYALWIGVNFYKSTSFYSSSSYGNLESLHYLSMASLERISTLLPN